MKRILSFLIGSLMAITGFAQMQVYLSEGFESGIPAAWTQEVLSTQQSQWVAESVDLTYPNGVYEGSARAALRNESGTTQDYVVRLITPELNIVGAFQPVLEFAHAQALRSDRFDTLTVYYRTSAQDTWHLLVQYTEPVNAWTNDTVSLIGTSATYQLAFEAKDNVGRGVVIDAVQVHETSACAGVLGAVVVPMSDRALLSFATTDDAIDAFVATAAVTDFTDYQTNPLVIWHTENLQSPYQDTVTGLLPTTEYYLYYRTHCVNAPNGYTEWAGKTFTTSLSLPFVEDFEGSTRPITWSYVQGTREQAYLMGAPTTAPTSTSYGWLQKTAITGTSLTKHMSSYAYSSTYPEWMITPVIDLASVSPDSAVALTFDFLVSTSHTGKSAITTASYLKQTEFAILVSEDGGETWTEGNTYIWNFEGDKDFSLAPYNGNCKKARLNMSRYIGKVIQLAFYTNSTASGARYYHVDNVNLDYTDPNCAGVADTQVEIGLTTIDLSFSAQGTNDVLVELSTTADYSSPVQVTLPAGTLSYQFTGLNTNTTYYVRLKQDCEDNDWVELLAHTAVGIPFEHPFSSTTWPEEWLRYGGSSTSAITSADLFSGAQSLTTTVTAGWTVTAVGNNCGFENNYILGMNIWSTYAYWTVSPSIRMNIEAGESARLGFNVLLSKASPTATTAPTAPVYTEDDKDDQFLVAISEDDGATWSRANATIWGYDSTAEYSYESLTNIPQRYYIDLTKYAGKTIRIAFHGESLAAGQDNYIRVGDIRIATYDMSCQGITNLKFSSSDTEVTATWTTVGANNSCIAQISSNEEFPDSATTELTNLTAGTATFTNLTANTTYYVRVRQGCEDAEWTKSEIATQCPAVALPYINGFEDDVDGGDPSCWTILRASGTFPQIEQNGTTTVYAREGGTKCLTWGTSYQTKTTGYASLAILPAINVPVSGTEISFYVRKATTSYSNQDSLYVGVMTNPLDWETFVPIQGFLPTETEYVQCFVPFHTYQGTGRYIAFARVLNGYPYSSTTTYYTPFSIDDIDVHAASNCYRVGAIDVKNITSSGATLAWDGTNATDYQVVVADTILNPDSTSAHIVYNQTFASTNVEVQYILNDSDTFHANTLYYVYVRGVCSDTDKGAWSSTSFRTLCAPQTPEELGVETFDGDLSCWHFGFMVDGGANNTVAGPVTSTKYGTYLELSKKTKNSTTVVYREQAYAIAPELDVDSINHYQVTFRAANIATAATTVSELVVGILTSPDDLSSLSAIKVINLDYAAQESAANTYTVKFDTYEGDYNGEYGRYVYFMAGSTVRPDSTTQIFIDDVIFSDMGGCPQLTEIEISNIGTNSARIDWEAVENASFEVRVSELSSMEVDTMQTEDFVYTHLSTTNHDSITGLTPHTQYYAYVRSMCGDELGNGAWSTPISFSTAIGVPYLETFDDMVAGVPNGDWYSYRGNTLVGDSLNTTGMSISTTTTGWNCQSVGYASSAVTTAGYGITNMAGKAMRCELYGASYNGLLVSPVVQLPVLTDDGTGIRMSLRLAKIPYSTTGTNPVADATDHNLALKVSTDDGITFHNVATWLCSGGDYDYNEFKNEAISYTLDISQYQGQSIRLGFHTYSTTTAPDEFLSIDSIALNVYNTACGGVKKIDVEPAGRSVTLRWELIGTPNKSYIEMSKDINFSEVLLVDSLQDSTSYSLSDLDFNSTYYFRIRQACDGAEWRMASYDTPIGIPYQQDFSAATMPADWEVWTSRGGDISEVLAGTVTPVSATASNTSTWGIYTNSYGIEGNHLAAELYSSAGGTYDRKWAVSPNMDLSALGEQDQFAINFDVAYTKYSSAAAPDNTGNDQFYVLGSTNGGQDWTILALWDDTTSTAPYYQGTMVGLPQEAQTVSLNLTQFIAGANAIRVAFYAQRRNTGGDNRIHIGNFVARAMVVGCEDPDSLQVSAITTTDAVLTWNGTAGNRTVIEWSRDPQFEMNVRSDTLASGLTYTLTNLQHSSKYYVRLYQICAASVTMTISTSFLTQCAAITQYPWTEDFADWTTTSMTIDIPCWRNEHVDGTATNVFKGGGTYNGHPAGNLYLATMAVNNTVMLSLPEMMFDAPNAYQFILDVYRSNTSNTYLGEGAYIFLSETDTLDSTAHQIAFVPRLIGESDSVSGIPTEAAAGWYTYTILLPDSGARHIILRSGNKETAVLYMDNFKVRPVPTCADMGEIEIEDITSSSATISIENTGVAHYDVLVSKAPIDIYDTYEDSLIVYRNEMADTICQITGLQPQHTYYFFVRGNCGENDKGEWSEMIRFNTQCLAVSALPWHENFDSYTSPTGTATSNANGTSGLMCWDELNVNGSTYPYLMVSTNTTYVKSSPNCLFFSGSASTYAYAVLPPMEIALNTLQIEFTHIEENATSSGIFSVGYMTNPADANTFVPLYSVTRQTKIFTEEKVMLMAIPDSVANTARLAFRYGGGSNNYYGALDDITVSLLPNCYDMGLVEASKVTATTAMIRFEETNADNYQVVVASAAINPDNADSIASVVYNQVINADSVLINGLNPGTDYHVYVRGICSPTEMGAWGDATFTTMYLVSIPYVENFDDVNNRKIEYSTYSIPKSWMEIDSSSYVSYIYDDNIQSTSTSTYNYSYSNPAAMRLYSSSTAGNYLILPETTVPIDSLQLSMKARCMYSYISSSTGAFNVTNYQTSTYAHTIQVGTIDDLNDKSTFQLLGSYTFPEVQSADKPADQAGMDALWQTIKFNLIGAEGKYICISSPKGKSNYVFIDDVTVDYAPDCTTPTQVKVMMADTFATAEWVGRSAQYEVMYGVSGFSKTDSANAHSIVVDTAYAILPNLTAGTSYDVYVRSLCKDDETSEWTDVNTFMTALIAPYAENFDDYAVTTYPTTWWKGYRGASLVSDGVFTLAGNSVNQSSSTGWYYMAPDSYIKTMSGTTARIELYSTTYNGVLTSPAIVIPELTTGQGMQLTFRAQACAFATGALSADAATHEFHVMVSTDGGNTYQIFQSWLPEANAEYAYNDLRYGIRAEVDLSEFSGQTINVAFYTNGGATTTPDTYLYLDSVAIDYFDANCTKVKKLAVSNLMPTGAQVNWQLDAQYAGRYVIEMATDATFASPIFSDTLATNMHALSNLTPSTTYYVRVQKECGSEWVMTSFFTPCQLDLPVSYDFEDNDVALFATYSTSYEYYLPTCWIGGKYYASSTMYGPSIVTNGTYTMSASGDKALEFYNYKTTTASYANADSTWVVLPMLNVESMEGIQMRFKMRPTRVTVSTGNTTAVSTSYAHRVIVGTVTDPNDIRTFVPVDTCTSNVTGLSSAVAATEDANLFWETFKVNFRATDAKYIAILSGAMEGNSTYNREYIDDINIYEFDPNCQGVSRLSISNITKTSAKLDFRYEGGVKNARVALTTSSTLNLDNVVSLDTITNDSTILFSGLQLGTKYYVFVQQLCAEGNDSPWESILFTTEYGVPFYAQFEGTTFPGDWTRWSALYRADQGVSYSTTTSGWTVVEGDNKIPSSHLRGYITGTAFKYWAITPVIDMTDIPNDQGLVLHFDAYMTNYTAGQPAALDGIDDRMVILYTLNEGQSWYRLCEWNNTGNAEYSYNVFADSLVSYNLNFTGAKGSNSVQFAFYGESTVTNATNYFHIGNISVLPCQMNSYTGTVCRGDDYHGEIQTPEVPFYISYTDYKSGWNHYEKYVDATATTPAILATLDLYVDTAKTYSYESSICEGETYIDDNFTLENVTIGVTNPVQIRVLTSANGCDSTVTMTLHILQAVSSDSTMTVCESMLPVMWNGREIALGGLYTDTLTSANGCDSIARFMLTVTPTATSEHYLDLCYGDTMYIGGQLVTAAGTYMESTTTAEGCDSVATYYVTALDPIASSHTETICKGNEYTDDLFIGLTTSGTFTTTTTSVQGCDSTVTLYLVVVDPQEPDQYITYYTKDLPLVIEGEEVLPIGTEPGEYTWTIETECGVVTYHITLTEWSDLHDLNAEGEVAVKRIEHNQLIIYKNGRRFNALGVELK